MDTLGHRFAQLLKLPVIVPTTTNIARHRHWRIPP